MRFIVVLLSILVSINVYTLDERKYLPQSTTLYIQADLYNLDELFKELTYKFYSDVHYERLKKYITELTSSELGINLMDVNVISKQGIDFKKKVAIALVGPGSTKYNLIISAQLNDITSFEKSIQSIFVHMYPPLKMREEFEGKRRSQQLKEMFKKDIKKLVFEKRIRDFIYKGYRIKILRNKEKGYRGYQYNEVISYVILDNRVFFGMESTLRKVINAYLYKESLENDSNLAYTWEQLDSNHRILGYVNFKAIMNYYALTPINKDTILTLSDGFSFSADIDGKSFQAETVMRLEENHKKYEPFMSAFDPKEKYEDSLMNLVPGEDYSYYLNFMDMQGLQKLVPLYDYLAPLVMLQQTLFPGFRIISQDDLSFLGYLNNTTKDGHFVLYKPDKQTIKTVDYHPHHLDFLYYTGIKNKSLVYNMIDTIFRYKLKGANSKITELKLNNSFFYYIKGKNIQLYAGIHRDRLILASQKERLIEFLNKMDKEKEKSIKVKLLNKEPEDLKKLKDKASFITFMNFDGLPVDIEIFDKNSAPIKKFDYLYYLLYRDQSDIKSKLKINFK